MIKYQIKEQDGYMVDADLPHNCIFNKARTVAVPQLLQ